MRPSTPRRRLEKLERKVLAAMNGFDRAEFLLMRLLRKGPLTEAGIAWLEVLQPLDPVQRCDFRAMVRGVCLRDGMASPWSEEDCLPEAAKKLTINWHITDRACEVRDGAPATTLVSPIAEEAWDDYRDWQQHPPYGDEPRPALSHETYLRLFEEQTPLYLKSCLRQPA